MAKAGKEIAGMKSYKGIRLLKNSNSDIIFDILNTSVLFAIMIVVLYPIYFIFTASFSDPNLVNMGKTWLLPSGVSLGAYKRILGDPQVISGYINSGIYTITGIIVNLFVTLTGAYALSRKDFKGGRIIMLLVIFTMFFNGGMIPTFLVVKKLNLVNTMWSMVLPVAVSTWNLLITRTYFSMLIPDELLEAAKMDGCGNFKFFIKIVLPLSSTIIAILTLLYGVSHWNSYFNALLYIYNSDKYPIQLILRNILIQNEVQSGMVDAYQEGVAEQYRIGEMIKYAIIVFSCLPIMIVYPLIQKYFVKGIMMGAIKG